MTEGRNDMAGDWSDGTGAIENRSPSDTADLVGHFAQASVTQMKTPYIRAGEPE